MTTLIITPDRNHIKRDFTGAFRPESDKFAAVTMDPVTYRFPLSPSYRERAQAVNDRILSLGQLRWLEQVAFFCHGYKHGLQSGHSFLAASGPRSVNQFAESLGASISASAKITLYACDTGRDGDSDKADERMPGPGGAGGFASRFTKALSQHRGDWHGWVDAHSTAGHTTTNPYVRRFFPNDDSEDGHWIVEPNSKPWKKWVRALKSRTPFRYNFTRWSISDIHTSPELR